MAKKGLPRGHSRDAIDIYRLRFSSWSLNPCEGMMRNSHGQKKCNQRNL